MKSETCFQLGLEFTLRQFDDARGLARLASLTPDFLPRLFALGEGLVAPVACNGRGIGLTTAAAWLTRPPPW